MPAAANNRSILVMRLGGMGDIVHLVPSLEKLRKLDPGRRIGLVVFRPFDRLIPPDLDIETFLVNPGASFSEVLAVARRIRACRFEVVADFYCNPCTAILSALSGIPFRAGFEYRVRRHAYNHFFKPLDPNIHLATLFSQLLDGIGEPGQIDHPRLSMPNDDRIWARRFLFSHCPPDTGFVGINPHVTYPSKGWPIENFIRFAKLWSQRMGHRVLVLGNPKDHTTTRTIVDSCDGVAFTHPDLPITKLCALIERIPLLLTCDTGPMNIAWGVKTPTVSIFGPTTRSSVAPRGDQHLVVYNDNADCLQCHRNYCDDMRCMIGLTPEIVLEKSLNHLEKVSLSAPKAVFLDRDGTLNPDPGYISSPDDFDLFPETGPALARLQRAGFKLFLITNQSGVARGIISPEALEKIHRKLCSRLSEHGVSLEGIFVCPHHPDFPANQTDSVCDCRKPLPGLILRALERHGLRAENCIAVGDRDSDVEMAVSAGVRPVLISRDGSTSRLSPSVDTFPTLAGAVELILGFPFLKSLM